MKNVLPFFLTIIYACFTSGSLWAIPVVDRITYERSIEGNNNEKNESEPGKEIEAHHFARVHKILPAKLKIPRTCNVAHLKRFTQPGFIYTKKPIFSSTYHLVYNNPLFLKNSVLRIWCLL